MRWERRRPCCPLMLPPRGAPVATSFPRLRLHHKLLLPPLARRGAHRSQLTDCCPRGCVLVPGFYMRHTLPPASGSLSSSHLSSTSQPALSLLRPSIASNPEVSSKKGRGGHEDPVRLVRDRGGDGGVLRGRGGAVRALRRGDPRRQQAGQQAPAAPARRARRQAPALRRMPGEGRLHLLRRGQGALLPRLRRAHPRPRHALREPPALPRHGDPRRPRPRPRLRRRRPPPRRRPPRPRAQDRLRPPTPTAAAGGGPARRVAAAAGPLAAPVPAAGLGRRRAPAVLRLRVRRRQAAQGFAPRVQGA